MYEIYVDGSYYKDIASAGYGFIVMHNNEMIHVQKGAINQFLSSWQISAELLGAIRVFEWCYNNKILEFTLYFDYQGIEDLAIRKQTARAKVTRFYVRNYDLYKSLGLKPNFVKVDRTNNLAHHIASNDVFDTEEILISDYFLEEDDFL